MSLVEIFEEPKLELVQPGFFRRNLWSLRERLNFDTRSAQVAYFSEKFSDSIKVYEKEVAHFRERTEGLRAAYEELLSSISDFEARKRAAQLKLSKPYSLDMRLLGHQTESPESVIREIPSLELSDFISDLRLDLDSIASYSPGIFEREYSTTQEAYIQAGERVLRDLEAHSLEIAEAKIDLETLDDSLIQLRSRRKSVFESYNNAKRKLRIYENFCRILKSDGEARAQIIALAVSERKLDLYGDALVEVYKVLAPVEASAATELALPVNPDFPGQLTDITEEQRGRTIALIEVQNEP
jgi:hypothetical protein